VEYLVRCNERKHCNSIAQTSDHSRGASSHHETTNHIALHAQKPAVLFTCRNALHESRCVAIGHQLQCARLAWLRRIPPDPEPGGMARFKRQKEPQKTACTEAALQRVETAVTLTFANLVIGHQSLFLTETCDDAHRHDERTELTLPER